MVFQSSGKDSKQTKSYIILFQGTVTQSLPLLEPFGLGSRRIGNSVSLKDALFEWSLLDTQSGLNASTLLSTVEN